MSTTEWIDYLNRVIDRSNSVQEFVNDLGLFCRSLSKAEKEALLAVCSTPYETLPFPTAGDNINKSRKTLRTQFDAIYSKCSTDPATPQELHKRLKIGYDRLIQKEIEDRVKTTDIDSIESHMLLLAPTSIDSKSKISTPQKTEVKIVIEASIEQVIKQLNLEQLQSLISSHPVEIVSITRGSVVIIVRSSTLGIQELYNHYRNGTLEQILGFPIKSFKTLNNQAYKSQEEQDKFSRELVTIIRNAGYTSTKLADIKEIVKESFTIFSQEIIDRIVVSLGLQSADINFQTRSEFNNSESRYYKSSDYKNKEIVDCIVAKILDFRSE